MSGGLENAAGGSLSKLLGRLSATTLRGVLFGAAVTAAIQSSSAVTVMVIGFVNSGIIKLSGAVGIIMGANLGTTVTSWILSLTGIEGDNAFIKMLKPSSFAPLLALLGIIFFMFVKKNDKLKNAGGILLGFSVLMFGMETMSDAVKPLADIPEFAGILTAFSNPLLGLLAGALMTAIIQSSSASVGILQALSASGAVTYASAVPIVMGQNIGTCITALLSSVGAGKNAKRAAFIHLYFNVIGSVVFLVVFLILRWVADIALINSPADAAGIAVVHTIFNLLSTAVLLPFAKVLEKLAVLTVGDGEKSEKRAARARGKTISDSEKAQSSAKAEAPMRISDAPFMFPDERFIRSPKLALKLCRMAMLRMLDTSAENFLRSIEATEKYEEFTKDKFDAVLRREQTVDAYDDYLSSYLIKLGAQGAGDSENSAAQSEILRAVNDIERISDHAENIAENAVTLKEKDGGFSARARENLKPFFTALRNIILLTVQAIGEEDDEDKSRNGDRNKIRGEGRETGGKPERTGRTADTNTKRKTPTAAERVEPLEAVIDEMRARLREENISRLLSGECHRAASLKYDELLTDCERVADHCSNLALYALKIPEGRLDLHGYAEGRAKTEEFSELYNEYKKLYS